MKIGRLRDEMKTFAIALTLIASLAGEAFAQNSVRQLPLGFCSMSSMSSATAITPSSCVEATATATGNGNLLTLTNVTGLIQVGETPTGDAGIPSGTIIVSQQSSLDPNGALNVAGVYVTSNPTTSSAASINIGGLPTAINYASICAYAQGVVWKDDGTNPTATPGTGGQAIASNGCLPYNGTFSALKFIQQTGGAILGVSMYK